jgi:predicted porin
LNKFLTSAAAVALLVGAASARADDSVSVNGITFYGTIDMGVAYDTHGVPNSGIGSVSSYSLIQKQSNHSNFGVTENGMSQSKLGVKGADDLGDGWTALFKLEAGISPAGGALTDGLKSLTQTNGYTVVGPSAHPTAYNGYNTAAADTSQAGQLFSRAAYVGVSNDKYGTLTFGRQNALETDMIGSYDPMGGSYAYALIGFSGTAVGSGSTEDSRWNNAIKYLYSYGPVRVAGMYSPSGTVAARNDTGLGADIGFDYAGLSIDGVYTHKKDEVSASPLTAATVATLITAASANAGLSESNTLNGSVFDATAYSAAAKYKLQQFTFYAGFEYIEEKNPSSPLVNGVSDIGGYNLIVNNASLPAEKDLTYLWAGARYQATPKLELAAAYYFLHQNDYSGANAADIKACASSNSAAGTCNGDEHVMSAMADYHFSKKFDVYGGVMYSHVVGSQENGFVHNNNIAPSAGFRYNF